MAESFVCKNLEELQGIADRIIGVVQEPSIILLDGKMGVGKTTLIKCLAQNLGVKDLISSPTFSLVNEYHDDQGGAMFHFDLYRIEEIEEAFDIGIEEYLDSNSWCFIEWPEIILPLLPESYWVLNVVEENGKRLIELTSSKE